MPHTGSTGPTSSSSPSRDLSGFADAIRDAAEAIAEAGMVTVELPKGTAVLGDEVGRFDLPPDASIAVEGLVPPGSGGDARADPAAAPFAA